ncbi:MAG: hypothetical protein EOO04_26835 [Chitinophagaceae bacterium]|nr:MAG: hypothetical protein EOO04_26835 [Chitinophagaceae bacterium]
MKTFIASFIVLAISTSVPVAGQAPSTLTVKTASQPAGTPVSITYPRQNQKVRGDIKIYGKAKPGAVVKLTITSSYFKTAHRGERIVKGEGPIKRMNRTFNLTADKSGNWILKNIHLSNAGWEENYSIKAVAEGKAVTVNVYDHVRPVRID